MPGKADLDAAKMKASALDNDPLLGMAANIYDEAAMEKTLPADVRIAASGFLSARLAAAAAPAPGTCPPPPGRTPAS